LALKWTDLDEANGVIHIKRSLVKEAIINEELETTDRVLTVSRTKTNASVRIIPVDDFLFDILREWKEHLEGSKTLQKKIHANQTSAFIFISQKGELRSYDGLRRQFARFLSDKGIDPEGITFHRFRHTYATMLIENGANPRIVQELLGHRDVETTLAIYTSVSIEAMVEATQQFAKLARDMVSQSPTSVQGNQSKTYIL
jgi:integrase